MSLDSITFAYDHRYAVGLLYLSAFDPARSVADSALLLLLLSLSLSPCVCLSRPSALCQANGVVARFLAESEEVRNKEGFIKIYRRYHPTGKKNRKDEGAKDEEHIGRIELPNGEVEHYEGAKDEEDLVRVVFPDGRVEEYK